MTLAIFAFVGLIVGFVAGFAMALLWTDPISDPEDGDS
jgi:hypothetical protein